MQTNVSYRCKAVTRLDAVNTRNVVETIWSR